MIKTYLMVKTKEEQRKYFEDYRANNKESIAKTHKAWRLRNRIKIAEKNRAYRLKLISKSNETK